MLKKLIVNWVHGALIGLPCVFMAANPVSAQSDDLFDIFKQVCVDKLHNSKEGAMYLSKLGWKQQQVDQFNQNELFGNVLFSGLKDGEAYLYLSVDDKSGMIFGKADNDLYPNSKCLLATKYSDTREFIDWANTVFKGEQHSIKTGKVYGNKYMTWDSNKFPENISAEAPYSAIILHGNLDKSPLTSASFHVSVTGLTPK